MKLRFDFRLRFDLFQVIDIERDINKALAGAGGELVYKTLTGLKADLTVESKPVLLRDEASDQRQRDANERKYKFRTQ